MTIYELYITGKLNPAIEKGLIEQTVIYCEIYKWYLLQRLSGIKYGEAIQITADDMNTSIRSVKRAISVVTK